MDGKAINLIAKTVKYSEISGDATEVIAIDLANLFEKEYDDFDRETFLARCCQVFQYKNDKTWDGEKWVEK